MTAASRRRAAQRRYYRKRRKAGMCTQCVGEAEPGKSRCGRCLKLVRDHKAAKARAGFCHCGEPVKRDEKGPRSECVGCLAKATASRAKAYRERRDAGKCPERGCKGRPADSVGYCPKHLGYYRRWHWLKRKPKSGRRRGAPPPGLEFAA